MIRPASLVVVILGVLALGAGVVAYSEQASDDSAELARAATEGQSLESKINAIPSKASVDLVKSKLGKPDDIEVFWTDGIGKCEYVYYGGWMLVFTREKLRSKLKVS